MIRVHADAAVHDFPGGTRFSTEDEFNNLCVWTGDEGEELVAVFADGKWTAVAFIDE